MKLTGLFLLLFALLLNKVNAQTIESVLAGLKTDKEKADTLFSFAMKCFYKSKFDSAAFFLNKGAPFAERSGDNDFISNYYLSLSNAFILNEEGDKGLTSLKKGYPYVSKISSYDLRMKWLVYSAMGFQNLHKIDSALYYYHQAELLNDRENPYKNWIVFNQIGFMFQQADAFEESEKYFNKSYELTKANGVRMDYGIVLYQFANLYYQWGKAEKFAFLVNEQQKFLQSGKKNYSKDPVHNMLFFDWQKEPFEKKVTFMKNVKHELLKKGFNSIAAMANIYLAEFYEENSQPEQGLVYVVENQQLLSTEKNIINLYINSKTLYRLLKKTGREKEAITEADRLFAMKDSLIKLQQKETMLELETKYETEKKEKDIAILNTENQLSELKLSKERNLLSKERDLKEVLARENLLKDSVVEREKKYNKLLSDENEIRISQLANEQALKAAVSRENLLKGEQLVKEKKARGKLIAGLFMLVLSGLVIFSLYGKQRAKNRIILKQAEDLQTLMKEIHHRVKNNLQVISSLLDLQSLSIKDKQAAGAVREGKIRVQSMALIHQNLYSEGNIKGIMMEDYIKSLVENLFHSYNIQKNKIHLVTDIDHLNLDVDTVIPLGLIVNELISNSLKYAFKETAQGEIYVALKENNKHLELKVKDNGCGFPPHWNRIHNNSFGYNLINAFAQKLKAKLDIYNDNGACVTMNISRYKLA